MAERRMFHSAVVESDAFLDLPISAQVLYFHLGMHADDDGFINGPKQIARSVGCSGEDLEKLIEENFLLRFEDVVVVRHWRMANSVRSDRLRLPRYPHIAKKIYLREDSLYTTTRPHGTKNFFQERKMLLQHRNFGRDAEEENDIPMDSKWIPDGASLTAYRIPKRKEGKANEKKLKQMKGNEPNAEEDDGFPEDAIDGDVAATAEIESDLKYMKGRLGKGVVLLSDEQIADLLERIGLDSFDYYVDKLSEFILKNQAKVKNHYATILKWWDEDRGVTYENESFTAKPLPGVYTGL